jgi:tetratricopeptide (TPR) repeat protein
VAAALLLGACAALLNPKGLGQYLSIFSSSASSALWKIGDEWSPFNPLAWTRDPGGLSFLTWLTADAVLLAFVFAAGAGLWRFVRRPSPSALDGIDMVLLGLSAASVLANLIAFRFLWLLLFPLLFVLRGLRVALEGRGRLASQVSGALAAASLALALAFPGPGGFRDIAGDLPSGTSDYLSNHYDPYTFHVDGVRFLRDSGLKGNLFNTYWMGGFLDYRLAPRLRTFIDGRMRFPDEVLDDYFSINFLRGARADESFLDVLERRQVDVFFGVGYPTPLPLNRRRVYTTGHLEGARDWLLVSRSLHHAIYLRRGERNRENLARVAAYYAREGIAFDAERGFDVGEVIRTHPDWAEGHGMLPRDYAELYAARRSPDPQARFRALDGLGLIHALLGDYAQQVAFDRRAAALRPDSYAPRRRLVNGLLRLGRLQEALVAARKLSQLDPTEPRNALILRVARAAAAADSASPEQLALRQKIHRLPAVSEAELRELRSRLDNLPLEAE